MTTAIKKSRTIAFYYKAIVSCLVLIVMMTSCTNSVKDDDKSSATLFEKLSHSHTGILFSNDLKKETEAKFIQEYKYLFNGGGVAIVDVNNDGLNDVLLTGNEVGNKLYLNKDNFEFDDITSTSGIGELKGWFTGVSLADVNMDGYMDIYICKAYELDPNKRKNVLLINQQNLTFKDEASSYQIDDSGFSSQACFFDFNQDGYLDLYVVNHPDRWSMPLPISYPDSSRSFPNQDRLYENRKDGTFQDVSKQAGLSEEYYGGYGLGISIGDIDADNDPDIYIGNDYEGSDFLYINNGDGTFSNEIKQRTGHTSFNSMGTDMADYNNDGYSDIFVLDMASEGHFRSKTQMRSMQVEKYQGYIDQGLPYQYMFNTVQTNQGDGTFSEHGFKLGVTKTDWSWGPLVADFDGDGYKDLFISNGFRVDDMDNDYWLEAEKKYGRLLHQYKSKALTEQMFDEMPSTPVENYVFQNIEGKKFKNRTQEWGLGETGLSQGAAYGDLDNDGDLDLVVNNLNQMASVYKNTSENNNHTLTLKFDGPENNPFGIGVKVSAKQGDAIQFQELYLTRGFQSSVPAEMIFALMAEEDSVEITVTWLDERLQTVKIPSQTSSLSLKYEEAGQKPLSSSEQNSIFRKLNSSLIGINFKHEENVFDDYRSESLLPYKHSMLGPKMAVGDVNNDGLEDFYIGGAIGQSGQIFIQNNKGKFKALAQTWQEDKASEDMGAVFFDVDNDGDLDLYVVSGGNEYRANEKWLKDRLYINNGKGKFSKTKLDSNTLSSGSTVSASDYDGDGDIDLYVAGRQIPGKYPYPASGTLWINENGQLVDKTSTIAPDLVDFGLVTDATWADIDNDDDQDLIVASEWSPITIFMNEKGELKNYESATLKNHVGWWSAIAVADFDNDGDNDIVAGNLGENYKYLASQEKPFHVYANDFDGNQSIDIVFSYLEKDQEYPLRGRECSSGQMPFIKEKFPTYESFAKANINDIYGEKLSSALHYSATNFSSVYIENKGAGVFVFHSLPQEAQSSSINKIESIDLDGDGNLDLIVTGNLFQAEIETPRNDSSFGLVMLGDGKGDFKSLSKLESGLDSRKDVKDLRIMNAADGNKYLMIISNNEAIDTYVFGSKEN